ncbi:MAG: hypothetical protein K0S86_3954, partial [Geminicoccaceae bacterium]|nr:hypothetical protein [Geminicoccaceae bacterium]
GLQGVRATRARVAPARATIALARATPARLRVRAATIGGRAGQGRIERVAADRRVGSRAAIAVVVRGADQAPNGSRR